jgi:F0F1-type ATP synthase membrane subunit a
LILSEMVDSQAMGAISHAKSRVAYAGAHRVCLIFLMNAMDMLSVDMLPNLTPRCTALLAMTLSTCLYK